MALSRPRRGALAWWLGLAVLVLAVAIIVPAVDVDALRAATAALLRDPARIALLLAAYASAFLLRAGGWCRVQPGLGFAHALAAIHVSLAGNHVLPARLGEVLRVASVVRRTGQSTAATTASTLTLRAADMGAVVALAAMTGPAVVGELTGGWGWLLVPAAAGLLAVGWRWLVRLERDGAGVRRPDSLVLGATVFAWLAEAVVIGTVAAAAGVTLRPAEAVLVTSVTIAAQAVALAPGGFGTYEAAATGALVALGVDAATALSIALLAHAIKTAYALATGAVGAVVPGPPIWGRLRLPRRRSPHPPRPFAVAGPVVLFLPAHNEEATVADVVARAPRTAAGRDVEVVVVDDGSVDATAARARAAGADVLSLGTNQGLGAAVRLGLAEGVRRGAAAVAFCDADGEYDPAELERLVAPILAGDADYVLGSRFHGDIERMYPHRRLGNRVLTGLLRLVSRQRLSDGQSGYRALSRDAAAAAEIVHDYNYAQVLTLDLLAKGYRYGEVPISYRFRTRGRSFVQLGPYLRAVGPAVWRELNPRPAD